MKRQRFLIFTVIMVVLSGCTTKDNASSPSASIPAVSKENESDDNATIRTTTQESNTEGQSQEKSVIDEESIYAEILKTIENKRRGSDNTESIDDIIGVEGINSEHLAYSLIDMDDDGIEELLIMDRIADEDDPYYSYRASVYSFFDIENGEAVAVYIKPSGSDYMNLREDNILCLHLQGAGFYQNNYVKYTGDIESPFNVIENVTMDARKVMVGEEEGWADFLGFGLSHCDKNAVIGKSHFSYLPEDMELDTTEEWIKAINDLDGYTLIDDDEQSRIDEKYRLFLPEEYTMFSDNVWNTKNT